MDDLISRQAAIAAVKDWYDGLICGSFKGLKKRLEALPSAQPEQPPYVAEIEAEYQKAVKMPHIHKPLAKALYEVWKKHDREDAERRAMNDLIDRQAAIKALEDAGTTNYLATGDFYGIINALTVIKNLPTAEKRGEWIPVVDGNYIVWECSECHVESDAWTDYCPNCGARMEVE